MAPEAKTEPIATRQAYGDALVDLGEAHEDVVALDADLAVSTQSMKFGKQFPDRFFNVGAAEANMMSISCGLAASGKVPYASTFAIFATSRSYDQVRLGIAHNELQGPDRRLARGRLAGRGRRLAPDDRGHRPDAGDAEDAGVRARRLQPGLPRRRGLLRARGADVHALRPSRDPDRLHADPRDARQGRSTCCARASDISIFACGHMVWRALDAADALEREDGVEAEVVNVSIIKPIDSEAVLDSLAKTGVGVTAEEHRVVGGLADAVREVAAEQHPVPVFALGMGDEFGVSGTAEACMEHFGLTSNGIADLAREALLKKPMVSHPPIHGGGWT